MASVVLHVPDRYAALLATGRRPLLYGAIRDLVEARGGKVVLAPLNIERGADGRPLRDGNLHVVDNGHVRAEGYLNAATAYLEGYWHLDRRGVLAASSIGLQMFDPLRGRSGAGERISFAPQGGFRGAAPAALQADDRADDADAGGGSRSSCRGRSPICAGKPIWRPTRWCAWWRRGPGGVKSGSSRIP